MKPTTNTTNECDGFGEFDRTANERLSTSTRCTTYPTTGGPACGASEPRAVGAEEHEPAVSHVSHRTHVAAHDGESSGDPTRAPARLVYRANKMFSAGLLTRSLSPEARA